MHRLVALLLLTATFAPAAVLGALPMVTSIVVGLLATWILVTARWTAPDPVVEPPVTPVR